jgi:hypothetical protein
MAFPKDRGFVPEGSMPAFPKCRRSVPKGSKGVPGVSMIPYLTPIIDVD